jgi:8-oxo-dGTP pyrophosphatase MutT (NUDIX family)
LKATRIADAVSARLDGVLLDPQAAAAIELPATVQAAVLVPLFIDQGVVHAVFTERRHDLPRHAGEISFPGGRREPHDEDLIATALRESYEEIGLPARDVTIMGSLEPAPLIASGFGVYPFVGMVPAGFRWTPSDREVASVIELSLPDVAAGYGRREIQRRGSTIRTDTFVVNGHTIWGATARIVTDLLERSDHWASL